MSAVLAALLAILAAEPREVCAKALASLPPDRSAAEARARIDAVLELAAERCPILPERIRRAAARARGLDQAARRRILLEQADAECVAKRCAPPPPLRLSPALLADLDGGTYAFAVELARTLAAAKLLEPEGVFWIDELLLASALEAKRS